MGGDLGRYRAAHPACSRHLVDLDRLCTGWLQQDQPQSVAPEQLPGAPRQALIAPIVGAEGDEAVGYLVAALDT